MWTLLWSTVRSLTSDTGHKLQTANIQDILEVELPPVLLRLDMWNHKELLNYGNYFKGHDGGCDVPFQLCGVFTGTPKNKDPDVDNFGKLSSHWHS